MTPKARVPWLTIAILFANLALAFVVTLGGGGLAEQYGFRADNPNFVHALIGLFLHWNLFHLLGNMLFLAAAGSAVEQAVGSLKFAAVYLLGGIVGVVLHWAVYRQATDAAPLIGASGCIASCVGFAAVRYGRTKVELHKSWGVPVWVIAMLWLALQITGMFVRLGDAHGGTAFATHIGGLGFGILMSLLMRAPQSGDLELARQQLTRVSAQGPQAAFLAAQQILQLRPDDTAAIKAAAEAAQTLGDTATEIPLRLKLVSSDLGASVQRLVELKALSQLSVLDRMKLASQADESTKLILLKSVAAESASDERPNALLELGSLEPSGGWLGTLLREYPMHPATQVGRNRGLIK